MNSSSRSPQMSRPRNLNFVTRQDDNVETERKLKEIMQISGNLTINGVLYKTDIKDMEDLEELGNGTCGHVVKMRHKPSGNIIAVKVCTFIIISKVYNYIYSKCEDQAIVMKLKG